MLLKINRFMLRHEGKLYKKGDAVDLPDDMAKALVENSAGAYSLLEGQPTEVTAELEEPQPETVSDVLNKATKKRSRAKK